MISSLKNFINSKFTPSEKDFELKGVLTPQQFIQAGDQLTNFGWKWQKSLGKPNKLLSDEKKQILCARATSQIRIANLINDSHMVEENNQQGFLEVKTDFKQEINQENDEKLFRKYTVYITYDQYYYTPRLWLQGTKIDGAPLNAKEIFQDINSQYQNQTVTQQMNPYLECRMLTIHPCKHSEVLRIFIQSSAKRGKKIKPHMSLIIFLKFMSSVMPTIRYDQTLDIQI